MTKKSDDKPAKICSLKICQISHRITITLPRCLSLESQLKTLAYLKQEYWEYLASYTWRASNVLRLIPKHTEEAFTVVRQYAESLVRRLNGLAT